ncbi:HAD family hydrolase [Salibacterium salarium]|uniref:HAD family hydrolase n=1 Tax=Salibacterium salarium TaxID=284579 RepID=A0A3R9PGD4_9BACI|nr:HAD family hydrolase [Salibacterium salarium]RSL30126.1 HAD family hydrolase [Salibacterium salarium]
MLALIFDFDGLIMDTETHQYETLQDLFAEYNSVLPLEIWQQEIGTSTDFSIIDYLAEQTQQKHDEQEFYTLLKERFQQRLAAETARPGVEEYLKQARDRGFKIGVASSSNYEWVSTHLKHLGLFDFFQCIQTSDDVEKVKPDPALYLQTAACLSVNPEDCLVFEDSANGALAAKNAGMACVIVPNKVTADLPFCEVKHRLDSMADMPLQVLLDTIKH